MQHSTKKNSRLSDKTKLLLKFNYTSSILSLVFGVLCYYFLDIKSIVPHAFFTYTILNVLNIFMFKRHGSLLVMAVATSLLSLISTIIIVLYSGGINSPFLFVLALIVLAGYVVTSLFGKIYLYSILGIVCSIYTLGKLDVFNFTNEIPGASKDHFALLSALFSVYLLGAIFGKNLLKTHHRLYKSKTEIEKQIIEKETLLKEIHHRVKNNLQTVSSLLSMQGRNTTNEQIKKIIKSSQNRVISMAIIHEMLYMNDNLSKIAFKPYVEELSAFLIKSVDGSSQSIDLNIDIPDVKLGIDTAIPLGLLINETITNSLKYGFHGRNDGCIGIGLQKQENSDEDYILTISDNGVGFSDETSSNSTRSLGLKLIHNLARQLQGSAIKDESKVGTTYYIKFKDVPQTLSPVA
ncbi:sensor histidine kinase [Maribacter algarum]|uniref:histidine kinase n=1 Tax=Maribacter algarum (ex Zhang et al. 2020) TaxID=2578118 RepID=A0A5S3PGS2_9FLAO|nr:sensor histidine kinase [Maribacter algarum]TMM53338.1 sensor histidine kinase [Maribacter algarum]